VPRRVHLAYNAGVTNASAKLERDLRDAVGAVGFVDDPDERVHYGSDRCRGGWPVAPGAVVRPADVGQVQAVVRACALHGVGIVPSGGRTGLTGAATATSGEVVLSLDRMRKVLAVDPVGRTLQCEAGVTVESVAAAAAEHGLLYPVDFAAKGSAQIGGTIATNAGGVRVIRYGSTRSWVMGMKVVLASGEVIDVGGALVKDNTGYDLRQLFIGAEGTLGIVVEATLRLCAPPAGAVVALCAAPADGAVLDVFTRVGRSGLTLAAFECFDRGCLRHVLAHRGRAGTGPFAEPSPQHVLIEIETPGATDASHEATVDVLAEVLAGAQEAGEITDAVLAGTPAQARDLWALREDTSESLHSHTPHKSDVTLPVAKIANFLSIWRTEVASALPECEAVVFGHVGDGNLHLNILRPANLELPTFVERCHAFNDRTYGLVRDFGGSISAEHGIGLLKRDYLHFTRSPTEIQLMRAVKSAFDPTGLLNPGKLLPDLPGES
jgi:FAD/FMN-containing dehydrogenase